MAKFAFRTNRASVSKHDVFGDGETEAGAARFAGAGFIDPVKTLEQARQVLGADARSEVLNEKLHCMRNGSRAKDHASSGRAVFQRIVDEIREHLMNRLPVR